MLRIIKHRNALILAITAIALCLSCAAGADSLQSARVLLKVSNTSKHFNDRTEAHARDVLRTYSSIIAMNTGLEIPSHIMSEIADCYTRTYAWGKFKEAFAEILTEHLDSEQIDLLIDLYRNQGLPPTRIKIFKAAIARVEPITSSVTVHILANSHGCVQQDAQLITDWLKSINHSTTRKYAR